MDLNFFLELEELFGEYTASGQILTLSEGNKLTIETTEFDYDLFRYDFDMCCRFIYLFSKLERFKYSSTYVTLLKYVMVLSSFLKNRTSTKISPKNEAYLAKATDSLVADFRINLNVLPEYVTGKMYDTGKMYIAFALVNIHEVVGNTRTVPRNAAAFFFLCNEADLVPSESSLISSALWMKDYKEVGDAMDETVELPAFNKYTQQPRPRYRKSFENQKLLVYGSAAFFSMVILMGLTEFLISHYGAYLNI